MRRTAQVIAIALAIASTAAADTFEPKPYLAEAGVEKLAREVTNRMMGRDLFGTVSGHAAEESLRRALPLEHTPRLLERQVGLSQMHTVGANGQRHVESVVHDQQRTGFAGYPSREPGYGHQVGRAHRRRRLVAHLQHPRTRPSVGDVRHQ